MHYYYYYYSLACVMRYWNYFMELFYVPLEKSFFSCEMEFFKYLQHSNKA